MTDNDDTLIVGDFDIGAYGPTLLIKLISADAAKFLIERFWEASRGISSVQLYPHPRVRLRHVASLELQRAPRRELKQLTKTDENGFTWRCTSNEWRCLIGLMEPFRDDKPGHQYLTSEVDDDALIEVSLHEHHVGL